MKPLRTPTLRALSFFLAALLLAASLASCGSGSPATTASQSSGEGSSPGSKPLPGHPRIASRPAHRSGGSQSAGRYGGFTRASAAAVERRAARRERAAMHRLEHKAGKAAPFLVRKGDNSIPTYGSESSSGERGGAEANLRAYLDARASGDWSAACDQMAATVQKQLALLAGASQPSAKGCAAAYAKLSSRIPAKARANPLTGSLTAFRVKSPHAFALFYGPKRQEYMMPMVSEGGAWRVNQLEPIPWPIGSAAKSP